MASVSSLTGSTSSSSSIYGNRTTNILSGLASGMDTEGMIEGLISGYKQKISSFNQDITRLQWQQQAYQSISDKLVEFSRKYTSYTSSTNLFSTSFFKNAVSVTPSGTYANLVSASGKTTSEISIKSASLASASRYTYTNNGLGGLEYDSASKTSSVSGTPNKLNDKFVVGGMDGSLTLNYGSKTVSIDFSDTDLMGTEANGSGKIDLEKVKSNIENKLKKLTITDSSGNSMKASDCIEVTVSNGKLNFVDKKNQNEISIASATGNFASSITDLSQAIEDDAHSITFDTSFDAAQEVQGSSYLTGKTISVTLNGQTKKISLDDVTNNPTGSEFYEKLQAEIDDTFGSGKVTVSQKPDGSLTFTPAQGNTFSIEGENEKVNEVLGFGKNGLASYLDTSRTLGDLLGVDGSGNLNGLTAVLGEGISVGPGGTVSGIVSRDGKYYDTAGNQVDAQGYRVTEDSDGNLNRLFSLSINGEEIGLYNKDTALETVINNVNSNSDAGVTISYSKMTNQFVLTSKQSGTGGKIEVGEGLGQTLFGNVADANKPDSGATFTEGQDATIEVTVNGQDMTLTRNSNTFEIDGMTITIDGAFKAEDTDTPITFTSKTNADTIVDAVKSMVEDYNAIIEEVRKAYNTQPLETSSGGKYEPLTDDEKADMSESAIENYEEQAKTGILYMDQDLSSLYSALRSAILPSGEDGAILRSIGIQTAYEDGVTTLKLDETALRNAIAENPDQVQDAFAKSKDAGSSTDGLMASIQKVTNKYAATTGETKGILIEKAGSQYSPTAALDNTILNKIQDIEEQIDIWQEKMSNKVDYYTNKFTQLELLINQMNSQSSSLAGLTSGY